MKIFFNSIRMVLGIHVLGLFFLFLFRFALFLAGGSLMSEESSGEFLLQATAFIRGVWFDNVIACYILALPLIAIFICSIFNYGGRRLLKPLCIFMEVLWPLTFAVSAGNIPFFLYFFKNVNSSIWYWAEYGTTTIGLMFGEWSYYPPIIMFFVLTWLFVYLCNKLCDKCCQAADEYGSVKVGLMGRIGACVLSLVCIGLCVFGIRGRMGYNPIKVSAAYYCEDAFLNQLGISPSFNLLTSTLDDMRPESKELHLMDADEAVDNVKAYLGREGNDVSPLYYHLKSDSSAFDAKPNVVMIIMESMSANLLGTFGNDKNLTPFLDSLAQQSILFTNCYSAGIHTNHGLYATLYSYPAIMFRNLMKGSNIPNYTGLPTVLRDNGYRNMFFMTHESQYDNMNAFFRTNGYDEIYSQENYPAEKVVNSFGVQDDFLFEYALERLKDAPQPFFANLLTISNHPPYVIPDWFDAKSEEPADQIVEYSDYSISRFFEEAKKQPWFENSVFVLLGDHGKLVGVAENDMPQSYNHIPLMIYSPKLEHKVVDRWTQQMDIQPTLLSLIGIEADQINFGVDVMRIERPYAFYTSDNVIGVRSHDRLLIYQPSTETEHVYVDGKEVVECDSVTADMRQYLFSNLQAAEKIVREGRTVVSK
ncbi:MAG: LTA synthase family protein [Bacteroidales bacterium]|nr:LTA synthase family protein [Bacteroidales bacterium]